MTIERLHGWERDQHCPKCGSAVLDRPTFHVARTPRWYVDAQFPFWHRCPRDYALDHLHYSCRTCGVRFATTTIDAGIRETK